MSLILVTRHEPTVSCIHRPESPGLIHWNVTLRTYLQLCLSWHGSSLWRHLPQSWRHTALVISIFISGGRRAGFFSHFFVSLSLSLSVCLSPPPLLFNIQDSLPFFDLSSVELLQNRNVYRVDGTGGQTLYRERVSVVRCRKAAAFLRGLEL